MRIFTQAIVVIIAVITISFSYSLPGGNVYNINFSKDNQYTPVIVDEIAHVGSEDCYLYSVQLTFSDTALLLIAHNFWWY